VAVGAIASAYGRIYGQAAGVLVVLGVALSLHLLGLWDDKKHLGPFFKLAVQFAAAIVAAVWADVRVEMFIENKLVTTGLSVCGSC
jgi:UDP-N-acetylmuramyl pentapeptide phosphotransferase/UDP-N-acetylglucosamine-1-phosphate transferase